jgi:hypothetical protein
MLCCPRDSIVSFASLLNNNRPGRRGFYVISFSSIPRGEYLSGGGNILMIATLWLSAKKTTWPWVTASINGLPL